MSGADCVTVVGGAGSGCGRRSHSGSAAVLVTACLGVRCVGVVHVVLGAADRWSWPRYGVGWVGSWSSAQESVVAWFGRGIAVE